MCTTSNAHDVHTSSKPVRQVTSRERGSALCQTQTTCTHNQIQMLSMRSLKDTPPAGEDLQPHCREGTERLPGRARCRPRLQSTLSMPPDHNLHIRQRASWERVNSKGGHVKPRIPPIQRQALARMQRGLA